MAVRIDGETYTCLLACERLFKLGACKISQTAGTPSLGHQRDARVIALLKSRITHLGTGCEENLIILEIGLLQYHLGTVGKGKLLVTQLLVLYSLLDLAWLRQLSHQWLLLHVVHVCLQLL